MASNKNLYGYWIEKKRVVKTLRISPWEGKTYLPRAYGPWEESFSSRGLIFGGFFNPWDEEISIPKTRPIRKSYILVYSPDFHWITFQNSHNYSTFVKIGYLFGE